MCFPIPIGDPICGLAGRTPGKASSPSPHRDQSENSQAEATDAGNVVRHTETNLISCYDTFFYEQSDYVKILAK